MLDNIPYTEVIPPLESLKVFHLLCVGARSPLNLANKGRDREFG